MPSHDSTYMSLVMGKFRLVVIMLQMLHLINKSLKFVELSPCTCAWIASAIATASAAATAIAGIICVGYRYNGIYIYNGSAGVLHNAIQCLENSRVNLEQPHKCVHQFQQLNMSFMIEWNKRSVYVACTLKNKREYSTL